MSPSSSLFAAVIEEHLELKRRNRHLEDDLPLDSFVGHDPFQNHPLFKTEADAQREEEETGEHPAVSLQAPADTRPCRPWSPASRVTPRAGWRPAPPASSAGTEPGGRR